MYFLFYIFSLLYSNLNTSSIQVYILMRKVVCYLDDAANYEEHQNLDELPLCSK